MLDLAIVSRLVFGRAGAGQMDLLTVILHELGHILGRADGASTHDADSLMNDRLDAGLRRLPDVAHDSLAHPD